MIAPGSSIHLPALPRWISSVGLSPDTFVMLPMKYVGFLFPSAFPKRAIVWFASIDVAYITEASFIKEIEHLPAS